MESTEKKERTPRKEKRDQASRTMLPTIDKFSEDLKNLENRGDKPPNEHRKVVWGLIRQSMYDFVTRCNELMLMDVYETDTDFELLPSANIDGQERSELRELKKVFGNEFDESITTIQKYKKSLDKLLDVIIDKGYNPGAIEKSLKAIKKLIPGV